MLLNHTYGVILTLALAASATCLDSCPDGSLQCQSSHSGASDVHIKSEPGNTMHAIRSAELDAGTSIVNFPLVPEFLPSSRVDVRQAKKQPSTSDRWAKVAQQKGAEALAQAWARQVSALPNQPPKPIPLSRKRFVLRSPDLSSTLVSEVCERKQLTASKRRKTASPSVRMT